MEEWKGKTKFKTHFWKCISQNVRARKKKLVRLTTFDYLYSKYHRKRYTNGSRRIRLWLYIYLPTDTFYSVDFCLEWRQVAQHFFGFNSSATKLQQITAWIQLNIPFFFCPTASHSVLQWSKSIDHSTRMRTSYGPSCTLGTGLQSGCKTSHTIYIFLYI